MVSTLSRNEILTDRRWRWPLLAVFAAVLFAFSGLGGLGGWLGIGAFWTKADYSHGFAVVPFAAYLLWRNRGSMPEKIAWPQLSGLPVVLGALGLYLVESKINVWKEWVQGFAIFAALAGVVLTFFGPNPIRRATQKDYLAGGLCLTAAGYAAGALAFSFFATPLVFKAILAFFALGVLLTLVFRWQSIRWAMPGLLMLLLALPIPSELEVIVSFRLRQMASVAAMVIFRLIGIPTQLPDPVTISVGTVELQVAEACSGLSMLLAFIALAAAIVFLCPPSRPKIDRVFLFLSAIPIAVICNILRIVVSGLVLLAGWKQAFEFIVHDFAGWLMMPLALVLFWLEFKFIDWILIPVKYLSGEEVAKAGFAAARAVIEKQDAERRALLDAMATRGSGPRTGDGEVHPAAAYLPLTPEGTSHAATVAGGTFLTAKTDETPRPPRPPFPPAGAGP